MPLNVNGHSQKTKGLMTDMKYFVCGYARMCSRTIGTRFTDDKDASRAKARAG